MNPPATAPVRPAPTLLGQPLTRRSLLVIAAGFALVVLLAAATAAGRPVAIVAAPVAIVFFALTLAYPFAALVGTLCAVSLLPNGTYLLGVHVPDWMQLVIPALLLGALAQGLARPGSRTFAVNWADVFIAGFIILGYLAIFGQRGPSTFKFYTNQQVMPALMYFVVKWLPIDRDKFHLQLRYQLLSVFVLSLIMVATPLFGFDPFYHGFAKLRIGEMARGPMWSISDTVAYTAIWPVFFLYAMAIKLPAFPPSWRRMWPVGLALITLATLATTERTGPVAIAAGFIVLSAHRRLRKYVLLCVLGAGVLMPLWLLTPSGRHVMARLGSVGEKGTGFERRIYREKTLRYVRSPYWNPVLGTGFGRIDELSMRTMPQEQWVYDYNWGDFRRLESFASRPTHCAPVTLLAEYGFGGTGLLLLTIIAVAVALARLPALAEQRKARVDSALIVCALGAFAGVMVNGLLHNTEGVVEVLISIWVFSGLVIGHPDIFLIPGGRRLRSRRSRVRVQERSWEGLPAPTDPPDAAPSGLESPPTSSETTRGTF